MDILHLESEASKLRIHLLKNKLQRNRLFLIYNFFGQLLKESDKNIIESYLLEFISTYSNLLSAINISGLKPHVTEDLIMQAEYIGKNFLTAEQKSRLKNSLADLKQRFINLLFFLDGNDKLSSASPICLPLIEKSAEAVFDDYGILASLSVQIKPNSSADNFHVNPSNGEPDPVLKDQLNSALMNAIRIAGEYLKFKHSFWDIYIDFEVKSVEYNGASFGLILVLKLVEEFLRFYDSPTKIKSNTGIALTGAVNNNGNIPGLTNEIISQKTKIVFYSRVKIFVLPVEDLPEAQNTINSLNVFYPNRKLKLIGLQTIDDLFNLRNVVEIKKDSGIIRTGKFLKKYWVSLILLTLLVILFFFSGLWDFDENPVMKEYEGNKIKIENKNGKILWTVESIDDMFDKMGGDIINLAVKFYDIDSDGTNEVIICREKFSNKDPKYGRIVCFNNRKEKLWQYLFRDTIYTPEYRHSNLFEIESYRYSC